MEPTQQHTCDYFCDNCSNFARQYQILSTPESRMLPIWSKLCHIKAFEARDPIIWMLSDHWFIPTIHHRRNLGFSLRQQSGYSFTSGRQWTQETWLLDSVYCPLLEWKSVTLIQVLLDSIFEAKKKWFRSSQPRDKKRTLLARIILPLRKQTGQRQTWCYSRWLYRFFRAQRTQARDIMTREQMRSLSSGNGRDKCHYKFWGVLQFKAL